MRFSMLYSGEQILSFKSCLVFDAGDALSKTDFFLQKSVVVFLFFFQNLGQKCHFSSCSSC